MRAEGELPQKGKRSRPGASAPTGTRPEPRQFRRTAVRGGFVQAGTAVSYTHLTDIYEPSDNNTRTLDENYNVVRVGDEMERVFTELGLTVVHDRTLYDYPKYNGAYDRSAEAVQRYLEQYPSIKIVLDVHRDALVGEDGTVDVYKRQP